MSKIRTKVRHYEQVVADVRQAVFAVVRHRAATSGSFQFQAFTLGSGFLLSSRFFATCHHVVNPVSNPHSDGDKYHIVQNVNGNIVVYEIENVIDGKQLHLFPDADFALLDIGQVPVPADQAFVALDFAPVHDGAEIGVAGYPIPRLHVENGVLGYQNLIYRVGRGVVSAAYPTQINTPELPATISVPVIEVPFLFVPGNSGGPVFRSDTGAVVGFVHGYVTHKVQERVEQANMVQLPAEMSNSYVASVHALYSLAIHLTKVQGMLQKHGLAM